MRFISVMWRRLIFTQTSRDLLFLHIFNQDPEIRQGQKKAQKGCGKAPRNTLFVKITVLYWHEEHPYNFSILQMFFVVEKVLEMLFTLSFFSVNNILII